MSLLSIIKLISGGSAVASVPTATVFNPAAAHLNLNTIDLTYSGTKRYSAFSEIEINTDASTVSVSAISTIIAAWGTGTAGVSLYLDNVLIGRLQCDSDLVTKTASFALTGTGTRKLKIRNGSSERAGDSGNVLGTIVTNITFPEGTTNSLVTPTLKTKEMVVLGDSISVGLRAAIPEQQGYIPRLRALHTDWNITSMGWGGRQVYATLGAQAGIDSVISQLQTRFAGVGTKRLYIALGVNDQIMGTGTPAQVAGWLGTAIDQIHATFSSCSIWVQTPLITTQESYTNSLGYTTEPYRVAIAGVSTGRPYLNIVDGKTLITTADLGDAVHPSSNGYGTYANSLNNLLSW